MIHIDSLDRLLTRQDAPNTVGSMLQRTIRTERTTRGPQRYCRGKRFQVISGEATDFLEGEGSLPAGLMSLPACISLTLQEVFMQDVPKNQ